MNNKVAFLGIPGSYTYIAAGKIFKERDLNIPSETIAECLDKVRTGKAGYAVIPVENSLNGSITETYDAMILSDLSFMGEIILHIHHNLLAKSGKQVASVYSNPQAIAQCRSSLKKLGIKKSIYTPDTATAARIVSESKDLDIAAIASRLSAEIFGLKIIKANIEDNGNNYTRFAVVSKTPSQKGTKMTVVFSVAHRPGSLVAALKPYVSLGLNLTKIESRPVFGSPWEYLFFLDFEFPVGSAAPEKLLKEMKKNVNFLKVLGFYPKGNIYET